MPKPPLCVESVSYMRAAEPPMPATERNQREPFRSILRLRFGKFHATHGDSARLPLQQASHCFERVHRQSQVMGENVAGAHRNDAERSLAGNHALKGVVDRTVSSGNEHSIEAAAA